MSNIITTNTDQPAPNETVIVGIGASAGGIEALTEFFKQVKPDSGLAYVVILHLSPDHDSQLAQILQFVAAIPVTQVTETVKVVADHVYVVPPNKHLQMVDGTITVIPNTHVDERRAPVDIFFRTLAESHRSRAIAVILSGTGANGSMGLKRIKENGGGVFVQDPREAVFNEMPRHSILTDLVDEVLPVAQIPARLQTYRQTLGTIDIPVEAQERSEDQQQALREVFTQLRLRTGHDFSNYKRPTLLRRLARRIHVRNLPDLPTYVAFLRENPEEVKALLKDLLISVTNFFRDSKIFVALEQEVIPALISRKKSGDTLRIWVAGCATGEEAYSLAMLLAERTLGVLDAPDIQIFATDIDEDAIATAREGLYTLNDAADVSPERLRRFFTKEGDDYRVRREIRETILFAHHNVLKDPPFSRLDLASCRNVLIYLNHIAQERILETFHFALNPGGYLLLGQSETIDGSNDLYATLSREHHLYQSRQVAVRPYPVPENIPTYLSERKRPPEAAAEVESRPPLRLSYGDLHQQLLEQYAPPSIIVNEEYDILHISDRAGRYLHIAGGEPTKNLLKLIRPELRLELRTAFIQATQLQTNVDVRNLTIRIDDQPETLAIHVRPVLREGDPAHGFVLVLFEPMSNETDNSAGVITSVEPVAHHLEEELMRVKNQLRASNEHHELQAEELKASNEELQAMNEELRSAAEELETGKEELQSINEELITVNQELKIKVEEITLSSNNIQNLINSTSIATLFLDRSLRVNLFTPASRLLFNLIPSDYGRPLTDITNRLDHQNLPADAERVLETLQPIEREVQTINGGTFIMRVLPYRTADDRINGVVVTFVDITERKAVAEALRESEEQFRLFVMASSDAIYKMSADWQQMLYLKGREFLADTNDASAGWLERYIPSEDQPDVEKAIQKAIQDRQIFELEHRVVQANGAIGWTFSRAAPMLDGQGEILEWFGTASDITTRRQAEDILRQSQERQAFLLKLSDALRPLADAVDIQGAVTHLAMDYFGADRCYYAEIEGDLVTIRRDASRPDLPSVANTYSLSQIPLFNAVSQMGLPIIVSDVNTSDVMDDELKQLCLAMNIIAYINVPVIKNGQLAGRFCITQCTPRDWTSIEVELAAETAERTWAAVERATIEEALRASEEKYRSLFDSIDEGFCILELQFDSGGNVVDWIYTEANPAFEKQTGYLNPIGKRISYFQPDLERSWFERFAVVARTGEPVRFVQYSEAMGIWYDVYALCAGPVGENRVSLLFTDITDRKEREAQQHYLLTLNDVLRPLADPTTIQETAMHILGTHLGVNRAFYGELHADNDTLFIGPGYANTLSPLEGQVKFTEFDSDLLDSYYKGQTVVINDLYKDIHLSDQAKAAFDAIRVRAAVGIPLVKLGKVRAILSLHQSEPRQWKAAEIALIEETAERTWAAVERARVEAALRESEEKYRTLFESIDEGVATMELIFEENDRAVDFRYLEHNVALTRQTGLTSDIIGKRVSEVFPDLEAYWLETYERVVKTGESERHEYYFVTLDSWFDIFISRVDGPGSHAVVCVYNNITERKRQEASQAFLSAITNELVELTHIDQTMEQIGERIGHYFQVSWCMFAELVDGLEISVASYGWNKDDVASLKGTYRMRDFLSDEQAERNKAGELTIVGNVQTDPRVSAETYGALGIRSFIIIPLARNGQWEFLLSIIDTKPRQWRPDEIVLLQEITSRIWARLERARAEEALRETEQRLASIRPLTLLGQTEDLAKIGSWDYNQQTGQFNWSAGMYKLFEIESGQLVQPEIYLEFAVEEDRAKARRLVNYLRKGKGHFEVDLRIWVDKQVKTLRIKADVIGEGDQKRALGVDLDISDQLAAQRQIQETAENLQAVLDGSPAAIGLLKTIRDPADAERIIDFQLAVGNRKLSQFFNKPLKKLLGQSAEQFSQLLWGGQTLDILRQVRLTGEVRYDEQRLPADGRWLAIAVTRQDDGVLVTALDVTEMKTIQDQQQHWLGEIEASRQSVDALSELRESLSHRSELLRAVSHDLRGNFGVINSALQLLNMAASEADRAQMMEMVLRNVKQATGMLTELLDYSRLETGQEPRTLSSFDVTSLLQELVQSLRLSADEQGLRLESSGPQTLMVENDQLLVYRMVQNLTLNAIKYTHKGSVRVDWGMDDERARWWFLVSDTGPGIDADLVASLNQQPNLSAGSMMPPSGTSGGKTAAQERSDVVSPATSWTKLRGEGIGLRIVRQLAQLLEARLEVSSEAKVGTRFLVSFPLNYP